MTAAAQLPRHIDNYLSKMVAKGMSTDMLPPHISGYFDRRSAAIALQQDGNIDYGKLLKDARAEIESELESFAERTRSERILAEFVGECASKYPELLDLSYKLYACHDSGTIGRRDDGSLITIWDEKCNQSKLCPHESRQESRRVEKRYMPPLYEWLQASMFRQAFYVVFTIPNVPAGMLELAQQELIDLFNKRIRKAREIIPVDEREGRAKYRPMFPSIKGAFAALEAPLAKSGKWNVHLNVVLMNDGYLDFAKLRAAWGHNLHIDELKKDPLELAKTLREVLKYSVQIVPTKSAEKLARHSTDAPAMTEWTASQFFEWYKAQQGFRRTRTYGELYKVKAPVDEGDTGPVQWLGEIKFCDTSGYSVDLIPADNFSVSRFDSGPENNCFNRHYDTYGPDT